LKSIDVGDGFGGEFGLDEWYGKKARGGGGDKEVKFRAKREDVCAPRDAQSEEEWTWLGRGGIGWVYPLV